MRTDSLVRQLYRVQQHLGMTTYEFRAAGLVAFVMLIGTGADLVYQRARLPDPAVYAEDDAYFERQSALADSVVAAPAGPIDLNSADAAALESLPRIGPATAARILESRRRDGPFATVDDLTRVVGIGPRTVEWLRPLVVAADSAQAP